MNDIVYWIWLSLSVTEGTDTFGKLIGKFDNAKDIYLAEEAEIAASLGNSRRDLALLCEKDLEKAEQIYDFCNSKGVGILTYADEAYPDAFRCISTPPVLLYYRGKLPDFNSDCLITVVGTRTLSPYGRRNAFSIAYDLATSGAVVVSGLAKGIDGVAHAAALAAGGVTVAFLGSGINVCYPDVHLNLAREIVKDGCILTEYPPNSKPLRYHFPRRNRLIAAISAATVIIEGKERSGATISATLAKEFGKKVYALPGNVDSTTSTASNYSIQQGAKLITNAYDVIADYEYKFPGKLYLSKIKSKIDADMDEALTKYKVSCVSSADDIFRAPRTKSRKNACSVEKTASAKPAETSPEPLAENPEQTYEKFSSLKIDKASIRIYRSIPFESACSIDSLVSDEDNIGSVLTHLMQLECAGMIELLPGERVKRKK